MASEALARKLQIVVKEDYDKEISLEEALLLLSDAVGYFDLLAKINHRELNNQNEKD